MTSIGAVVIGGDFQALGVIRSLSEHDIPVFLVEHEWSISRYSRYVQGRTINNLMLSNDSFADYLIELASTRDLTGWVLYPNNDETVKLLSLNRDRLASHYRNPVPPWETVRKFYIKRIAYEIAERLPIPIPRMYRGENIDDLLGQDVKFPVVLKPGFKENFYAATKKKAVKVNDRESLIKEYKSMSQYIISSEIVVQELITGGPKNLYSYAAFFDGERVVAGMSARRSRQHPMDFGKATTFAESVSIPELKIMATKILKAIGYYGLAEVEFMKDEKDGQLKFLEINGRPWGWHTLAKASGVNLPFMLFQHMTGGSIEAKEPREGVKWVRLMTDIPTVLKELLAGRMSVGEYLKSLRGKKEFAVFSLKDPIPFFMEYAMLPYLWRRRGF
jgi:D-aspartate ligase